MKRRHIATCVLDYTAVFGNLFLLYVPTGFQLILLRSSHIPDGYQRCHC